MELCHAVLTSPFTSPELTHWTLANGVHCVAAEMPDAPLTCLDLWCRAGSASEDQGEEGMAHFLEHMVFKGSERMEAGAFDRAIEALGGSSNAATGFDDVHFHVLIPPEQAPVALELLLDLVLNPALAEDAFELERDVVLEEIAQYEDQPDEQVLQQTLTRACPQHAYGRPILGWPKSLQAMTPATMRQFHQRRYRGPNCCLAISGCGVESLRSCNQSSPLAERPAEAAPSAGAALQLRPGRHQIAVDRLESARLLMLWSGASAADQNWVVGADLATTLLGEGRRSRLVARLREELQIAETVDMDLTSLEQGSLITLEISCDASQLETVEACVHDQLSSTELFSAVELDRGRQLVGKGLRYSLESSAQVASMAASHRLWGRQQHLLAPLRHLEGWSSDRIQADLMRQLRPERACTVIATPGGQH